MRNSPRLELHIPEPPARPGDTPSFEHLKVPPPGALDRPDSAAPEPELRHLPYGLMRVLDDDGQARGAWVPRVSPQTLLDGLRAMMLTRSFDDRMFRAHRQGKTSFYLKSTGEEAIGAAQSMALGREDMAFPTYRMVSWLIARGYPLLDLVNQVFSNAADPLQGRQLPVLYSAREYGFYSISGNLGTRFPAAVGWAMASAFKNDDKISIGYIGDGSTAEGDFHEALTFASVFRAPVILSVANNQWALSSFSGIAGDGPTTFAAKAIAYGIPGLRVDANDFLAVWAATEWAAERARGNHGPTLIELFTYRVAGHSSSDDPDKYRPSDEGARWPLGDPIERLKQHLIVLGEWDEERHAALAAELEEEVRAAMKAGEAIGSLGKSKPDVSTMFEQVFREPDWRLVEQRKELGL